MTTATPARTLAHQQHEREAKANSLAHQEAISAIIRIAKRESTGSSEDFDGEDVSLALADAGLTPDDYEQILLAIPKIERCVERIASCDRMLEKATEYRTKFFETKKRCEQEIEDARREWSQHSESARYQRLTSVSNLQQMSKVHPYLFKDVQPKAATDHMIPIDEIA